MERLLASEILCQVEKEAKVLSTHSAFVQKMKSCSWKGNRVCVNKAPHQTVLGPPRSAACHTTRFQGWGGGGDRFCKGEGGWGFLFQVNAEELRMALLLLFCALSHCHPREQRHSLKGNCPFWVTLCAPRTQKRHPGCPLHAHSLIYSTQSTKATAASAESSAEFLRLDRELPLPL